MSTTIGYKKIFFIHCGLHSCEEPEGIGGRHLLGEPWGGEKVGFAKITVDSKLLIDYSLGT
jgi:hypothetical protein